MGKKFDELSPAKQRHVRRQWDRTHKAPAPVHKPNREAQRASRRAKRRAMRSTGPVVGKAPARINLKCMHCGGSINVKADRKKDMFCCPHCRGVMDVSPFLRRK